MKKQLITALFVLSCSCANAETGEDKTVFYIDDTEIRTSTFTRYHQAKGYPKPKNDEELQKQNIKTAQELINIYLLSREAEQQNLDKTYEVIKDLELARNTVLMKAMVNKYSENFTVSDNDLDKAYQRMQQNAGKKAEFKIRNIVLEDENQAKLVLKQLNNGSEFIALEEKYSKESFKSGNNQIDWMNTSMLEPEMAAAVSALAKGKYTENPVKTRFGWHLIKLEDKKTPSIPPLGQIKKELTSLIKQEMLREKIRQLRSKATIKTAQENK